MLAFPSMLVAAAHKAEILVPPDVDKFEKYRESHPHFFVLASVQLGKSVRYHGEHWHNAEVIGQIPNDEIRSVGIPELIERGFSY